MITYRLPDGSDDQPDAAGRHTATVNVLHSAEQSARFPGCAICLRIAWLDQHANHADKPSVTYAADGRGGVTEVSRYEPVHASGCEWCARRAGRVP